MSPTALMVASTAAAAMAPVTREEKRRRKKSSTRKSFSMRFDRDSNPAADTDTEPRHQRRGRSTESVDRRKFVADESTSTRVSPRPEKVIAKSILPQQNFTRLVSFSLKCIDIKVTLVDGARA